MTDVQYQGPLRLLVVEDESEVREVLVSVAESLGFVVSTAVDGLAAVESLKAETCDLILTDLSMPRLDGYGLLEYLRTLGDSAPGAIVLTSIDDPVDRIKADNLGAIDFISKPFRVVDLERRLGRARSIFALEQRLRSATEGLDWIRRQDPAVGVGSAAALFGVLEAEFTTSTLTDRSLSCLVVADDGYSEVLEAQGGDVASDRLRKLAQAIKALLPRGDHVFRVDASELVVIMPGAGEEELRDWVAKFEKQLAQNEAAFSRQLVLAGATYPHPEVSDVSSLFRAANLTLAYARDKGSTAYFEGF